MLGLLERPSALSEIVAALQDGRVRLVHAVGEPLGSLVGSAAKAFFR